MNGSGWNAIQSTTLTSFEADILILVAKICKVDTWFYLFDLTDNKYFIYDKEECSIVEFPVALQHLTDAIDWDYVYENISHLEYSIFRRLVNDITHNISFV